MEPEPQQETEIFKKLKSGVEWVIKSWSNIIVMADNNLGSYERKKIDELSQFFDTKKYKFEDLSTLQIIDVLVLEMTHFIDENEISEFDVDDFIRTFMFEALDCVIEDECDKELLDVRNMIYKLMKTLENGDESFYEQLKKEKEAFVTRIYDKILKKQDPLNVKDTIQEESDGEEVEEYGTIVEEEEPVEIESLVSRKKKRKRNKKTVTLENMDDEAQDNDDGDDDINGFVFQVEEDDNKGGWM